MPVGQQRCAIDNPARKGERTMKKHSIQVLKLVLENLPAIITSIATLVTAVSVLVSKLA
jgi:uncharacterized membrane protein